MQTINIILITAFSLVTLTAAILFIRGLFPLRVARVQSNLEAHWKRSFWIGLANTLLISVIVAGLGALGNNVPLFYIPTFAIYGCFLVGLLFGMSAFIQILGERLFPDLPAVKKDIRAGAVALLASALPFVGWFLLLPYLISLSLGAVVITLFQKENTPEKPN